MSFYKRQNETLLSAPTFVAGPGINLQAENYATYTYPIDGWYWYDTLDEALEAMKTVNPVISVTPRQARLALVEFDILDAVITWINAADIKTQIDWEFALEIRRDWPPIAACATALGLTEAQLDSLFEYAAAQ